jgi:ubiquinol-cytochrome c reductase cytochrome c1 subunit
MMLRVITLAAAALIAASPAARAAGETIEIPQQTWTFSGPFGTYDRAAVQRGFAVYKQICSNCHAMRQMAYRNLRQIGFSEAQVAAIAAEFQVPDLDDTGQPIQRPALPSDRFRRPYPNEAAARASNNGAYPPDLSVMVKARADGANYIHALLTGYVDPPAGFELQDGMNYNAYFPGHQIAMPNLLTDEAVEYTDGTPMTTAQYARDVTYFLTWAAEPEMEERKALGVRMILFLTVLTGLTYMVKRKVWADVH